MSDIELTAKDGAKLGAYVSSSEAKPRGAIIVIQEIFGVNAYIREVCDQFAAAGYTAIAPSIFDRIEPGFVSGYSPEEVAKARAFVPKLDWEGCMLDVQAALDHVAPAGTVGIVGYCLGGTVAFLGATRLPGIAAASCYYGRLIQKFADEVPQCPVQLHYGALDEGIGPDNYEDVRARRPDAEFYLYEGADHGFACTHRPSFQQEAADLALARTMKLFGENVG